jgi:hypothetical protein
MSTVGTLVRFPGVVRLSIGGGTTILRGQLVCVDTSTHLAKVAAVVGDRIVGIALSDSDPDSLTVDIGCKGGYTVSVVPKTGDTFFVGSIAYQDQVNFGQVTVTATASKIVGWVIDPKPDSLGNLELGFYFDLEA